MSRGAKKVEVDPEEQMRRKFHAKCLFRALGRLAMANTYWLIEGIDEYEGLEDVKRRVAQAIRGKSKKKQLLTINDKALLNKPAEERTDQERQYLYRIIGGLKCFKRYPNHVKRKLAAATYFKYYSPGRVIVREHHEACAMYFIVTGDVTVSHIVYDELIQKYQSVDIGEMHAGDMFGEVSLLHNIPRTATVTTNGHCEFLALMKEDFKNVLQASVQRQWDEVRKAMSAFNYFDVLDEVAKREGCIVAKMKSYEINDILLGDGAGIANFVYFVLSGKCQMVESIQMTIKTHLGRHFFTLYDPYIPKEESEQDFDAKYFGAYKDKLKSKSSKENEETSVPSVVSEVKKISFDENVQGEATEHPIPVPDIRSGEVLVSSHGRESGGSIRISVINEMEIPTPPKLPPNLRTFFMQVCIFNPGSSFGFGENMRNRRIIALTPVECLLLPKIWLLQRNTANIWTRIQHYLEKKIPTTKMLFKEFVETRRWQEFKDRLVEDVLARANTVNWTSVHDVPYSIRMEEMLEI